MSIAALMLILGLDRQETGATTLNASRGGRPFQKPTSRTGAKYADCQRQDDRLAPFRNHVVLGRTQPGAGTAYRRWRVRALLP
jgi:hypothetical protein